MLFSIYMVIMMLILEKHFWNSGKLSDHFLFLEQNQFSQTQFVSNLSHNHSQKPKVIYLLLYEYINLGLKSSGHRGQIHVT